MPHLNEKATEIFNDLIARLGEAHHIKLDSGRGYMPLSIEKIGKDAYALAHYGKKNGDLMADPDMAFIVIDGLVHPMTWRNDYLGLNDDCVIKVTDGVPVFKEDTQKGMAHFANTWMHNIQAQQL